MKMEEKASGLEERDDTIFARVDSESVVSGEDEKSVGHQRPHLEIDTASSTSEPQAGSDRRLRPRDQDVISLGELGDAFLQMHHTC